MSENIDIDKMKKLIILVLLLTSVNKSKTKVDYCKLTCLVGKEVYKSTACNCKLPGGNREEYKDDVVKFRKLMLRLHNEFRNKTAMGDSGNEFFPSASDMNVLNYDLELEYVAHCYAGIITHGHDNCRRTSKFPYVGQNLDFRNNHNYDQLVNTATNSWYKEISMIKKDILNQYTHIKETGHFTQMVWAKTKYIGCVPIWNPDAPKDVYKNVLICNYAPAGNMYKAPVYKKGKPCGSCPNDCNKKYPGLCGKFERVPTNPRISSPDIHAQYGPQKSGSDTSGTETSAPRASATVNVANKIFLVVFCYSVYNFNVLSTFV